MLKTPIAKTAPITIALCALSLTPLATIAIEDCGTSVTECELRKQIKDLQQQNQAQQRQIEELQAAQSSLRQKTDAISVSSGGNVGIGKASPGAKLEISGSTTQLKIDAVGVGTDAILFFDTVSDAGSNYNTARLVADAATGGTSPTLGFDIIDGDGGGWNRTLTIKATPGRETSGNVGIGTRSPSYKLDVAGTIRGNNVTPSDQRYKQNIHPVDNALTKLQELRGVSFEWKKSQAQEAETQIGLIAQEVEGVLPELVSTDEEGYKSIAYGQLTAVLIEAVKEQQQIIEQKSATITKQQEKIATQDERMTSLEAMMQEMVRQMAALKRETVGQPVVQTLVSP